MGKIFWVINKVGDLINWPFGQTSVIFDLAVVSFFCAFLLLLFFKHFSNQVKIKLHRSKIFGYFLDIGIYRDQFGRVISSQGKLLKHTLIYLRYVLPPFMIMTIPVIIVCMQIENRLGYLPIEISKTFIIHAALDSDIAPIPSPIISKVHCKTSSGILLETPPLRIEADGDVYWRARLTEAGSQFVKVAIGDSEEVVKKKVVTDHKGDRFCPVKMKENTWNYLLHSAETPIASDSHFKFLTVNYLPATYPFFFWEISPVMYFFILSLGFGLVLKPFIKVNI